MTVLTDADVLCGDDLLPGFAVPVAEFFSGEFDAGGIESFAIDVPLGTRGTVTFS